MSTLTRCHSCDRPEATSDDYKAGACGKNPDGGCECAECVAKCWGDPWDCGRNKVDWRARCLQAESALALMSAPLSPEALQAIAEDSES